MPSVFDAALTPVAHDMEQTANKHQRQICKYAVTGVVHILICVCGRPSGPHNTPTFGSSLIRGTAENAGGLVGDMT